MDCTFKVVFWIGMIFKGLLIKASLKQSESHSQILLWTNPIIGTR